MLNRSFQKLFFSVPSLLFVVTAQASSVCSVSEYFSTASNPTPSCGSYDYYVSFSVSCDGGKPTATKPVMYLSGCEGKITKTREQIESGYLVGLNSQGYHIVGNYRLNDSVTVFTLEK